MSLDTRAWLRTIVATTLAVLYPGVGHLFLRRWRRAVGWFGFAFLTAVVAIALSDVSVEGLRGFEGAMALQEALPAEARTAIVAVVALNVLDAFLVSRREAADAPEETEAPTCPSCGEELDESLDFCPWCTERLD